MIAKAYEKVSILDLEKQQALDEKMFWINKCSELENQVAAL